MLPDEPNIAALVGLYATDHVLPTGEGSRLATLDEIEAARPRRRLACDLTALVTLFDLGLLEDAARFAGGVVLPAGLEIWMGEERSRLNAHQPSRVKAARAAVAAIEAGMVQVGATDGLPRFSLHPTDEQPSDISAAQVVVRLAAAGEGDAAEKFGREWDKPRAPAEQLKPDASAQQPEEGASDAGEIMVAPDPELSTFVVDSETLRTLASSSFAQAIWRNFTVRVAERDRAMLESEVAADERRQERVQSLDDLRRAVARIPQITFRAWKPTAPRNSGGKRRDKRTSKKRRDRSREQARLKKASASRAALQVDRIELGALTLARNEQLALLADDRVLQQVAVAGDGGTGGRPAPAAFGTPELLNAMRRQGSVSAERAGAVWQSLIRRRHRFTLPPTEVLVEWAASARKGPPGRPLIEFAAYVHDCMRDAGLRVGDLSADQPNSPATAYFTAAARLVGSFVSAVWADGRFSANEARRVSAWAMIRLLPSPPRVLPTHHQAGLAGVADLFALSQGLLDSALREGADAALWHRQGVGLRLAMRDFGVQGAAYRQRVRDVIRGPGGRNAGVRRLCRIMGLIAYGGGRRYNFHDAEAMAAAGTPMHARETPEPAPNKVLEAASAGGETLDLSSTALMLVVRHCGEATAYPTANLVTHPDLAARRAAVTHLRRHMSDGGLGRHARLVLEREAGHLTSTARHRWRPAAVRLSDAMSADFDASVAAVRLGFRSGLDNVVACHWRAAVEPEVEPLLLGEDGYEQLIGDDAYLLGECGKIDDALATFDRLLGHLPAEGQLAVEWQLGRWLNEAGVGADAAWDALWRWAADPFRPWRRYHAARLFLERPDLLPPEQKRTEVWRRAVAAAAVLAEPDGPAMLAASLAAMTFRRLRPRVPAAEPDKLACASWRVGCVLAAELAEGRDGAASRGDYKGSPSSDEALQAYIRQAIDAATSRSFDDLIATVPAPPSYAGHAASSGLRVYAGGMLAVMSRHAADLRDDSTAEVACTPAVAMGVTAQLVVGCCFASMAPPAVDSWAAGTSLTPLIDALAERLPPEAGQLRRTSFLVGAFEGTSVDARLLAESVFLEDREKDDGAAAAYSHMFGGLFLRRMSVSAVDEDELASYLARLQHLATIQTGSVPAPSGSAVAGILASALRLTPEVWRTTARALQSLVEPEVSDDFEALLRVLHVTCTVSGSLNGLNRVRGHPELRSLLLQIGAAAAGGTRQGKNAALPAARLRATAAAIEL